MIWDALYIEAIVQNIMGWKEGGGGGWLKNFLELGIKIIHVSPENVYIAYPALGQTNL